MTPRELQDLARELAARMRAEIEALPADHPMRRWLARHDAAEDRRLAAEARVAAEAWAARQAESSAHDARIADLRRRLAALEGRIR
jgi:polyhydroxyalkanoate synthesis regulator phasin